MLLSWSLGPPPTVCAYVPRVLLPAVLAARLCPTADALPPLVPVLTPVGDELFESAIHSSMDARVRSRHPLEGPCQNAKGGRDSAAST
jgi:hypothetical protein